MQDWRRGTLSKREYCRKHALVWSSFDRWVRRLSQEAPLARVVATPTPSAPLTLIPVQLHDDTSPASACVIARAGKVSISLPVSLDAAQAGTWLSALAQVS